MIETLKELVEAIDARWEGESERKRSNAISPRMEEAIAAARKVLASEYVSPVCTADLSEAELMNLKPGPIEFVPAPEYVEIGHLLRNSYGFVSAHVPDLASLPEGKTPVFKRLISPESK